MAKRIVLCCDGTWNRPDQAKGGDPTPTNVTKFAAAVARRDRYGTPQVVVYHRGVGTAAGERLLGGAFGVGLSRIVRSAYRDLLAEYERGDQLFLVGFSRGAYVARSVAGLIRNCGILRPEHVGRIDDAYALYRSRAFGPHAIESQLFRRSYSYPSLTVRFVGVWDTVGALGLPWSGIPGVRWLNRRWSFHDTRLSGTVGAAFQALSIDEKRKPFAPAVWQLPDPEPGQVLEQVWFAGDHSNVGGGHVDSGLSDIALQWMARRAREQGLALVPGAFGMDDAVDDGAAMDGAAAAEPGEGLIRFAPDPMGEMGDARKGFYRLWRAHIRPIGESGGGRESVASSVLARRADDAGYRPANLEHYLGGEHEVTEV